MPLLQGDRLKPRSSKPTLRVTTESLGLLSPQTPPPELDKAYIKQIVRKIDWRILPLMFLTLSFNFIDKTVLANASVYGLTEDIVSYNLPTSIFTSSESQLINLLEPTRKSLIMGVKHILLRISSMGIPCYYFNPKLSCWVLCWDQCSIMGSCSCCHFCDYRVWSSPRH